MTLMDLMDAIRELNVNSVTFSNEEDINLLGVEIRYFIRGVEHRDKHVIAKEMLDNISYEDMKDKLLDDLILQRLFFNMTERRVFRRDQVRRGMGI